APFRRELVRDHARGDVNAGARPERHDEAHAVRRPGLRWCLCLRGANAQRRQSAECKEAAPVHEFSSASFFVWPLGMNLDSRTHAVYATAEREPRGLAKPRNPRSNKPVAAPISDQI